MTANTNSLTLDKLFIRQLYFRDASNRPIPANQVMTTRGDGGIYFSPSTLSTAGSFNQFRAGSNIILDASNAVNTLWFQPGPGIEFASTVVGTQAQVYINATGPEQIVINGGGSGTLPFSRLVDETSGGRTLFYAATGDTTLNISDTTVLFGSAYNSSYSSLTSLTASTLALIEQQSTILAEIQATLSTVDIVLVSTNISTFYSSLTVALDTALGLSSFVYSTFTKDLSGNRSILTIPTVNAQTLNTSSIYTSSLQVGSNAWYDVSIQSSNGDDCSVFVRNGVVSTYTNFMNLRDTYTSTTLAFEKQYLYSVSTVANSTFQTVGFDLQMGWFPQLSTITTNLPPTIKDRYYPIVEQIEVQENVTTNGTQSTVLNYYLQNIGFFDKLCGDGLLLVTNPQVSMNNVTVSSINGVSPSATQSSFSYLYADNILPSTLGGVTGLSNVHISTIDGIPYGTFSTAIVSSLTVGSETVSSLFASSLSAFYGSLQTLSTGTTSFSLGTGNAVSTVYLSTQQLGFGSAFGSSLTISSINGQNPLFQPLISTFSTLYTSTLYGGNATLSCATVSSLFGNVANVNTLSSGTSRFALATGFSVSTVNLSTGQVGFVLATGGSVSTTNLSTSALGFSVASGPSISTTNLATTQVGFVSASGGSVSTTNLSTSALGFSVATGPSISTTNLATTQVGFVSASGGSVSTVNLSTSALDFLVATGPSISTTNVSATQVGFSLATGASLSTTNLSTGQVGFEVARGGGVSTLTVSTGQVGFSLATGGSVSTVNLSTGLLGFGVATGGTVNSLNVSTGQVGFSVATGGTVNSLNVSTGQVSFSVATGGSVSTTNVSTNQLGFNVASGTSIDANTGSISSLYASSIMANVINVMYLSSFHTSSLTAFFDQLYFSSACGGTLDVVNASTGITSFSLATGNSVSTTNLSTVGLGFLTGIGSNLNTYGVSTGTVSFDSATGSSVSTTQLSFSEAYGSSVSTQALFISTINGQPLSQAFVTSSFSTVFWSTAAGLDATISTLRVSTIMGDEFPIFTFDMTNRRVGVNLGPTQQPRATVDVSGIVYASNFVTTSDRRLKSEIEPLSVGVIPSSYRYRHNDTGEADIGVMADEIEAIAPECVYVRPDGYKAVSYTKLVPLCFSLIRSLSDRIEMLEKKV